MKRMQSWRWAPVALLLASGGMAGRAEDFAIQSFDGTGRLTFNEVPTAEAYRVEWAPSPAGPWTNTWNALAAIVANGSGIVTCSVPMCYRVVATLAVPAGMALIPAGSFQMGDCLGDGISVAPVHTVYVSAFYMDQYEVTKAKWDGAYAWAIANGYSFDYVGSGKALDHPVHTVNWYDMVKWCNARSEMEGLAPCYTVSGVTYKSGASAPDCDWAAGGYRLPTEAEWEKAARGGVSGRRFPWGDSDEIQHARANYISNSSYGYDTSPTRGFHPTYATGVSPYTSPVGAFAANGYGLYDMAGNVWELCWDWYESTYYSSSPGSDPRGPSSGAYRVARSGGWSSIVLGSCNANRSYSAPDDKRDYLGFRSVRRAP